MRLKDLYRSERNERSERREADPLMGPKSGSWIFFFPLRSLRSLR